MPPSNPSCPRCSGTMSIGVVPDYGDGNYGFQPRWVEGEFEKNWYGSIQTKNRRVLLVETYRCERCGFLESYANEPAKLSWLTGR